ncbi:hypothetical protein G6L37_34690 [Agrobacterium rubi]|nr:hypothetical protein [Agrobacterium rubi]NTF23716.1 hypothetical protein [Agrobacterium rubi]
MPNDGNQNKRSFVELWVGQAHPSDIDRITKDRMALLSNPDFDNAGKVHDWRNHVSEYVQSLWHEFSDEQRAAIALGAEDQAGNEEWD